MKIKIRKSKTTNIDKVDFDKLEFGVDFSDHMYYVDYENGEWKEPRIEPYGPMKVYPALSTLHYGQAVFEGLKAFLGVDGKIRVFRADKNHERYNMSCERMCIPTISWEMFFEGMKKLIDIDKAWIPKKRGCSLYIRPFVFATDNFLGVRVSYTYRFMIITSPVGAYYKEGLNPVKLITSGEFVRAVKGGLGAVKTPANYAASLFPGEVAKKKGFTQVLWLDGIENKCIEEVGTMNIMFVIDGTIITPPLEGSILPGVTRNSVISLAKHWGIPVEERKITIDEVMAEAKDGRLHEVFGTGTAAVISPVGWIQHNDEMVTIHSGEIGPISQRMYDEITAMQYGEKNDPFGWCIVL